MKDSKALKVILFISGLIGAVIGGLILFTPVSFYAMSGIDLGQNISLLNEVRAAGGALLACGLFIMTGTFVDKLRFTATVISTLLYMSYGLSRVMSMVVDGIPANDLVQAAVLEMFIGSICVIALIKYRTTNN